MQSTTCFSSRKNESPFFDGVRGFYLISSGVILFAMGVAKLIDVANGARVLQEPDPFFKIGYGQLLVSSALIEIVIALACLSRRPTVRVKLLLLLSLAAAFISYRAGLWLVGWVQPCSCLGGLADGLGLTALQADTAAKWLLGYISVIGYWLVIDIYRKRNL